MVRPQLRCFFAVLTMSRRHVSAVYSISLCYRVEDSHVFAPKVTRAEGALSRFAGNGTQHIFEHDPSVLYMSIHRYDGCAARAGRTEPGSEKRWLPIILLLSVRTYACAWLHGAILHFPSCPQQWIGEGVVRIWCLEVGREG